MTTKHTNLALVEGEVYILSLQPIHENDMYFFGNRFEIKELTKYQPSVSSTEYYTEQGILKIITSTANIEGISQLDRKHFVKPKVDLDELAKKYTNGLNIVKPIVEIAFKAGYNAKEAEFTIDDMRRIWAKGVLASVSGTFEGCIKEIQPLSLPKSITTDENYNVISVDWK